MSRSFITGVAFGAALTTAGIHQPAVIVAQMKMQDWHMVTTFLTASGTSTLLVTILQRFGYMNLPPRGCSSLELFTPFDGNIIGGWLLGAGMALSGACPGTVFSQVGSGVRSSIYTLVGTTLGGIVWSGILRPVVLGRRSKRVEKADTEKPKLKPSLTLSEQLGLSQIGTFIAVEAAFASAIAAVVYLASPESSGLVSPVVGGLLVAGAQAVSIATRRNLLGTSSCFEEIGDYFWWALRGGTSTAKPKSCGAITLTMGMVVGALAVSLVSPAGRAIPEISIAPIRAISGGLLLAVGSRMAGGCTSGHGISGISLLSVSSFVTVASMFVGGMGLAAVM
ncbi:hypothetical protein F5B20DRAFT_418936 [Whalleya microplaca]|nr:hypothetical protein F5B20DRAFT_418936 [Whalleya microplaca]